MSRWNSASVETRRWRQRALHAQRAATLADVGNAATVLASDLARTSTSTEVNISCGAIVN